MTLTPNQQAALDKLTDQWQSAYELREHRNTLGALVRKGLAETKHGYGAMFSPRTEIKYRLTLAGRQVAGRQA